MDGRVKLENSFFLSLRFQAFARMHACIVFIILNPLRRWKKSCIVQCFFFSSVQYAFHLLAKDVVVMMGGWLGLRVKKRKITGL